VIQFIGGFLFGSFPGSAYRPLLQLLYARGYSLVLHRFPFNPLQFNHWQVALGLLARKQRVLDQIQAELDPARAAFYADPTNTCWLGHSLGCKFILLLEILSNASGRRAEVLCSALPVAAAETILEQLAVLEESTAGRGAVIRDQPSILLAPEISNTVRVLRSGWQISRQGVQPNMNQTKALILASRELFNLTGVIGFDSDGISLDDVDFLRSELARRGVPPLPVAELEGWHFEPLGLHLDRLTQSLDDGFDRLRVSLGGTPLP
jgi:hypothetical protein